MHTVIVGAGPTGLFTAIALARRGGRVTVVDRDPGPGPDGSWERRGVMQFHHPHALRQQIVSCLEDETPEIVEALVAAGTGRMVLPAEGGRPAQFMGLHCRRSTFERELRAAARAEPGVTWLNGHADDVLRAAGRAAGLRVDGHDVPADLVINASGRSGRIGDDLRARGEGADCGVGYVSRHYELLPGAAPGPVENPIGLMTRFPGFVAGVFLQDSRTVSVLVLRPVTDRALAGLRHEAAFEAAVRIIPGLDAWASPERTRPISGVLPGGHLRNTYRGQLDDHGRVALPGLIHLGDAVCTTNPTAGRGIATSLLQARHLLGLLDSADDPAAVTAAFDTWCTAWIRPWFDDHLAWDADQVRQLAGDDVDLARPLTSGHLTATGEADGSLMRVIGPYLIMDALPATLAAIEPRAREIYAGGWRPAVPAGPTRDDLVELIMAATG